MVNRTMRRGQDHSGPSVAVDTLETGYRGKALDGA